MKKIGLALPWDYLQKFEALYFRLEPENLHMDGEATKSQVIQRERQIKREWKALEAELGHKVPYYDLEALLYARWQKQA